MFAQSYAEQWENVWMFEVFPYDCLPAKPLKIYRSSLGGTRADERLTLRIALRLSVVHTRKTFTATRRPL